MRKIKYLEDKENKELIFDEDNSPDIVGFNKNLISKKTEDLKSFKVRSKGKEVEVDLVTGQITVDEEIIDLKLGETESKLNINNLRWINFHRMRVSYRMAGLKSEESTGYGIGWQAEVDGKNLKRIVLVTDKGHTLETE